MHPLKLAAATILSSFIIFSTTSLFASQGAMFVYHRFGEPRLPSTNISLDTFANQLAYLSESNVPVLALSEVALRLKDKRPLPEHFVVLTVDDGYTSFLEGAMPLLRRYQFPVTLFVSSGSVGASGYLDWDQLRQLQKKGVEIGNHSHTHPHLVNLWLKQGASAVKREIERSQAHFEKNLGKAPRLFAYPFGEAQPDIRRLVREAGFLAATVQHSGGLDEQSDRWQLPRFAMGGPYATLEGFKEKSRMHALPVEVLEPPDGIVRDDNPPHLIMKMRNDVEIPLADPRCFVSGRPDCSVKAVNGEARIYEVVAESPLKGRRNRYTLTGQDDQGRWYWYSWLWIDPDTPE